MKSGIDDESAAAAAADINNWLGFSLSPHMKMEAAANHPHSTSSAAAAAPPNFYLTNSAAIFAVDDASDFHPAPLSVMPLKSDGSLCVMEALSRSHSQGAVMPSSSPKLEDFLGGASMAAAHHYSLHPRNPFDLSLDPSFYSHETFRQQQQQQQQQQNHFYGYNFYQTSTNEQQIPNMSEEEIPCLKTWMDHHHHHQHQSLQLHQVSSNAAAAIVEDRSSMRSTEIQSLSLSMSPGSQSSCITASRQISPAETTDCAAIETKKRGAQKLGQKQTVHRKSIDTFGQRTSQYRGVTRHRWTGRYEAHLWDNSCKKEGQTRKGRQVYLGGYDMEDKAARAYDLAALKYWGPSTHINFALENYHQELEGMKNMSRQEYVAHLRRKSSGFSRGASIYRGVTRHHQHGRWQARIGRVAGNKDLYLGTFSTQEEAAEAYDIAAIKFRGVNAVTNFDISRYDVEKIMASNTLPTGEVARRNKDVGPVAEVLPAIEGPVVANANDTCDWKMVLHNEGPALHHEGAVGHGSYHNPPTAVGLHDLIGLESRVDEPGPTAHFSNESSSLVTSLSSSREASPERYGGPPQPKFVAAASNVGAWIPRSVPLTAAHLPVFAAWNDA